MWNGGIHMESTPFHVEYRWKKITKMGEILAKTYSMWNGQIPCGIRGHGKDLPCIGCLLFEQPLGLLGSGTNLARSSNFTPIPSLLCACICSNTH